jgi:hypothetical protein
MTSSTSPEFWRRYFALPPHIRQLARRSYRLWAQNPKHRSLHFKKIRAVSSIRIGLEYRALGLLKGDTVHWFWIALMPITTA